MMLDDALLFVKALFDKYWREDNLSYTIVKEKTEESNGSNS